MGAVPRSKADSEVGKHFFFEKMKQKTFDLFRLRFSRRDRSRIHKVYWFFFSKKNRFLLLALARRWAFQSTWAVTKEAKNFRSVWLRRVRKGSVRSRRSFCCFFQKEALSLLPALLQRVAQSAIVNENIPKTGASGQVKKRCLAEIFCLGLSIAACTSLETVFSGSLQPVSGTCDPSQTAVLTLRHHAVAFAPNTGTLVLRGTTENSGHISAELNLPGIDHKPYSLTFDATRQGDTIKGTYSTPRCRYAVALTKSAN